MSSGDKPVIIYTDATFNDVLNETCERLKEKHAQYSVRRIYEMEKVLNALEQELNQFLWAKPGALRHGDGVSNRQNRRSRQFRHAACERQGTEFPSGK